MNLQKMIFLDRDGVLNRVWVHEEQGTIDSPMNIQQVELFPEIPKTLKSLQDLGFGLCIVTNQPAAAKRKTTLENLQKVHQEIVRQCESQGAKIITSKICFHRSEDNCSCRKPKPGMLLEVVQEHPVHIKDSWMIGDGEIGRAHV